MSAVSVLHAEEDATLGDRIVGALRRQGHAARRLSDAGDLDDDAARIVIWSQAAMRLAALHDQARDALARGALIPVAIGGAPYPRGFESLTPVDLSGWSGDDEDPRWRFIVDEINLAARRAQLANDAFEAIDEEAAVAAPLSQAELFERDETPSLPPSLAAGYGAADDDDEPRMIAKLRRRQDFSPWSGAIAAAGAVVFVTALTILLLPSQPKKAAETEADAPPTLAMVEAIDPQAEGQVNADDDGFAPAERLFPAEELPAGDPVNEPAPAETFNVVEEAAAPVEAPNEAVVTPPERGADLFAEQTAVEAAPEAQPSSDDLTALIAATTGGDATTAEAAKTPREEAAADETPAMESAVIEEAQGDADYDDPASTADPETSPAEDIAETSDEVLTEPSMEDIVAAAVADAAGEAEPAATPALPASVTEAAALGAYFRDCVACPDMARVPSGSFLFGAPSDEPARHTAEGPQVDVTFEKSFAIATREVTFDQWQACVDDGGCAAYEPYDFGWGRGARPAVAVSFEDAQNYIRWLSQKTGRNYRLPTEAEWEYAARAGATTAFSFGNGVRTDLANYNGAYRYRGPVGLNRQRTTPTASFPPNAFGLYDMHGNVWEWTGDCWAPDHAGAPLNGAGVTGNCSERVVKGGAWNTGGWRLRAAHRIGKPPAARENDIGFRVVRELP